MTFEDFRNSLQQPQPPASLNSPLLALWHEGKGDWDTAHDIAQEKDKGGGAWVHAYLHRKEGDQFNAGYWYRRAGKPVCTGSLEQEWEQIARHFLQH